MVRFFVERQLGHALARRRARAGQRDAGRLPPDTFVTAFYGVLFPGHLIWAGAGHLPPIHVSGPCVRTLEPHGLPLRNRELARLWRERARAGAPATSSSPSPTAWSRHAAGSLRHPPPRDDRGLPCAVARPEDLVSAVHDEITDWSGGLGDDAVAWPCGAAEARSSPSPARSGLANPLQWRGQPSAYARAGVDQTGAGSAVGALVAVLAGIETGAPSRSVLAFGLPAPCCARRQPRPGAVLRRRRHEGARAARAGRRRSASTASR